MGIELSVTDCEIPLAISLKSKLFVAQNRPRIPNNSPKSQTLLTTNAFCAA